jgi:predicted amidohydrolase
MVAEAAVAGADLLVLPELFLCGYDMDGIRRDPDAYAVDVDGPELSRIGAACRAHEITTIVGACVRTSSGLANSAVVVAADGRVLGSYAKTHLPNEERGVFVAGDTLLALGIKEFRLGIGICYDEGFPEFCRAHVLAGADVLVFASAFDDGDPRRRFDLYPPSRALENTAYVVVANAFGWQGGVHYFGRSAVFDPAGRTLMTVRDPGDLKTVSLSGAAVAQARSRYTYLRDRRDSRSPGDIELVSADAEAREGQPAKSRAQGEAPA